MVCINDTYLCIFVTIKTCSSYAAYTIERFDKVLSSIPNVPIELILCVFCLWTQMTVCRFSCLNETMVPLRSDGEW
ncbi:unnamed protein product [Brassica rapa subsp. trilocularis]